MFDLVQVFSAKVVDVADEALTLEAVGDPAIGGPRAAAAALGIWKLRAPEKWRCSGSGVNTETLKLASSDLRAGLGLNDLGLDHVSPWRI